MDNKAANVEKKLREKKVIRKIQFIVCILVPEKKSFYFVNTLRYVRSTVLLSRLSKVFIKDQSTKLYPGKIR